MTIVVIGRGYWGRGATVQAALKAAKWIKKKDPYVVFAGTGKNPHVTDFGMLRWTLPGKYEKIGEFNMPKRKSAAPNRKRRRGRR